jgi:hypothetical protein
MQPLSVPGAVGVRPSARHGVDERSGLRKLRAKKLELRQVDDLCTRLDIAAG